MKKHARFLLIALVVVAVLSAAIYALAAPSSEADEDIALQTVTFQEEEIPATESLAVLTDNPQFAQHGFQVRPVSDAAAQLSAEPMIDRDTAIETAVLAAQARAEGAVSVNAVLVDFTDTETPALPESDESMTNVRAWIVTFSGVTIERGGPAGAPAEPVRADFNVVIDADSGKILETFAYAV